MSQANSLISTIDVSPLFGDDIQTRDAVDQQIGKACETLTFFMVTGLPEDLYPNRARLELIFSLFDQFDQIKQHMGNRHTNPDSKRGYRGY